ncbi:hypothetical protein JKP88DRAFT_304420 [Tribonema minus]|uniref:Ion transport domain-containing protein n=1 Tax=Tribonema minus TaxID=303371 RepID=A0A836CM81_9STRA|nr:hypothetical protein JKP88DRAFT_304420 [Tribonema minus]
MPLAGALTDERAVHAHNVGLLVKRAWRRGWRAVERFAEWYFQTRWVQLTSLVLTVLSCILYVIFTYFRTSTSTEYSDVNGNPLPGHVDDPYHMDNIATWIQESITITFVVDFALSLVIAPSALRYVFSWPGLVDILSIIPILEPLKQGIYVLSFTRFLRLTKAFTILRQHRLRKGVLAGEAADLSFNVFLLGVKLAGLIFIATSIVYALAEAPNIKGFSYMVDDTVVHQIVEWHDAFYFTIVTLSTVGYGDITPKTWLARMVMVFIIMASFIIIPLEVARLADAYSSVPRFRVAYKMAGKALHVIIATSSGGGYGGAAAGSVVAMKA